MRNSSESLEIDVDPGIAELVTHWDTGWRCPAKDPHYSWRTPVCETPEAPFFPDQYAHLECRACTISVLCAIASGQWVPNSLSFSPRESKLLGLEWSDDWNHFAVKDAVELVLDYHKLDHLRPHFERMWHKKEIDSILNQIEF